MAVVATKQNFIDILPEILGYVVREINSANVRKRIYGRGYLCCLEYEFWGPETPVRGRFRWRDRLSCRRGMRTCIAYKKFNLYIYIKEGRRWADLGRSLLRKFHSWTQEKVGRVRVNAWSYFIFFLYYFLC